MSRIFPYQQTLDQANLAIVLWGLIFTGKARGLHFKTVQILIVWKKDSSVVNQCFLLLSVTFTDEETTLADHGILTSQIYIFSTGANPLGRVPYSDLPLQATLKESYCWCQRLVEPSFRLSAQYVQDPVLSGNIRIGLKSLTRQTLYQLIGLECSDTKSYETLTPD